MAWFLYHTLIENIKETLKNILCWMVIVKNHSMSIYSISITRVGKFSVFIIYMVFNTGFLHPWYEQRHAPFSHILCHHPLLHLSRTPLHFLFELSRILFSISVHIWCGNYDVIIWTFQYKWRYSTFERRKYKVLIYRFCQLPSIMFYILHRVEMVYFL